MGSRIERISYCLVRNSLLTTTLVGTIYNHETMPSSDGENMATSNAPLTVTESRHGSWIVIEVVGDLDLATAPQLIEAFGGAEDSDRRAVAFDLAGVRFIDSSGLRAMLEIRKDDGATMALIAPSDVVTDLLELAKLTDAFDIVTSVEDLADI